MGTNWLLVGSASILAGHMFPCAAGQFIGGCVGFGGSEVAQR